MMAAKIMVELINILKMMMMMKMTMMMMMMMMMMITSEQNMFMSFPRQKLFCPSQYCRLESNTFG